MADRSLPEIAITFDLRVCVDEFVADCRDLDVERRRARVLRRLLADVFVPCVFGRIDAGARLLVEPVIADHAVLVRMRAGQQRRVADAGISCGMAVVIVAVPGAAIEQRPEAALTVLVVVFDQLLLREAVDHHEQDKLGWRLAARSTRGLGKTSCRQTRDARQESGEKQSIDRRHVVLPVYIRCLVWECDRALRVVNRGCWLCAASSCTRRQAARAGASQRPPASSRRWGRS